MVSYIGRSSDDEQQTNLGLIIRSKVLEDEIHREEEGNKKENTGTQDWPSEGSSH